MGLCVLLLSALVFSGALWVTAAELPVCMYTFSSDGTATTSNGTKVCCRDCPSVLRKTACIGFEVTFVFSFCSMWIGAVLAFFFDRIFGSPLPGSIKINCRRRWYECSPCFAKFCCSEETLLEESNATSRSRRRAIGAEGDECSAEYYDYFFEEDDCAFGDQPRRQRAATVGSHDGIDESCRANVTVHTF